MLIATLITVGSISYACMVGLSLAFLKWLHPPDNYDGDSHVVGAVFWPVVLPTIATHYIAGGAFARLTAQREAAAEELKRRIAELDAELQRRDAPSAHGESSET
jgi:hypothetical protein